MIMGMGEDRIFSMMSRVDSSKPPGVLISISKAWALLRSASAMARPMYSSVIGWIESFTTIFNPSAEEEAERTNNSNPLTRTGQMRETRDAFIDWAVAALPARAWLLGRV